MQAHYGLCCYATAPVNRRHEVSPARVAWSQRRPTNKPVYRTRDSICVYLRSSAVHDSSWGTEECLIHACCRASSRGEVSPLHRISKNRCLWYRFSTEQTGFITDLMAKSSEKLVVKAGLSRHSLRATAEGEKGSEAYRCRPVPSNVEGSEPFLPTTQIHGLRSRLQLEAVVKPVLIIAA